MVAERVALKHIHYHMYNYIASGNLLYDSRSSNLVLCDNLEGWDGMGWDGKEVQERRDICIPMVDSSFCMAETNTIL